MTSAVLTRWEPENAAFWQQEGRAVARRNLWISIPALTLAFAVYHKGKSITVLLQALKQ